jgi:O-succinylbenzoic acid--CoA ligase
VEQVLAVGWPDDEWGQRLVAFYVPSTIDDFAVKLETLRTNLVNYKIPKQMIQVARLPLDERGKVDRSQMEQLIASFKS